MAKETETAPAPASKSKKGAAKGDTVHVITGRGESVPATVTEVHKDDKVDLELDYNGEHIVITSSPRDDDGKRHDSWHLPK